MDMLKGDLLKKIIKEELDSIKPEEQEEERRLLEIHRKISERSNNMKLSKKKMVAAFAAVLTVTVMGTVTAVAAGKITSLISVADRNETIYSAAELIQTAGKKMGTVPKVVDAFSNGISFKEGTIIQEEGTDENNNVMFSYSGVHARYGENNGVILSIHKQLDDFLQESGSGDKQEVYQDITLTASAEYYLFLPPDAEPSQDDLKLEEEGKLMISYGSSQEERKVLKSVVWCENGLDYLLFTYDDIELDTLMGMAKEVIHAK